MHFHTDGTYESEVWLDNAEVREQSLCLVVLNRWVYNDVIARNPVDGGCDTVLVASLQRVEDAEDLGGVATSGCGVREDQSDRLLGVNDEDLEQMHVSMCLEYYSFPVY
jgi:hypothetical protein